MVWFSSLWRFWRQGALHSSLQVSCNDLSVTLKWRRFWVVQSWWFEVKRVAEPTTRGCRGWGHRSLFIIRGVGYRSSEYQQDYPSWTNPNFMPNLCPIPRKIEMGKMESEHDAFHVRNLLFHFSTAPFSHFMWVFQWGWWLQTLQVTGDQLGYNWTYTVYNAISRQT